MLWLILGVILLVIAIAGGAIVHPVLFALAILALVLFFPQGLAGAAREWWESRRGAPHADA